MWIIFGGIAITGTFMNLFMYIKGYDYKLPMAIGLAFTSLTLCAEYNLVSNWVILKDWSALLDVVPTMKNTLWILTIFSILLNLLPLFLDLINKK